MPDPHATPDRAAKFGLNPTSMEAIRLHEEGERRARAHAAKQERKRIRALIRAEPFLVAEPEALHPGEKIAVADYRRRLLEKIGNA
jgi:hypothetical protein